MRRVIILQASSYSQQTPRHQPHGAHSATRTPAGTGDEHTSQTPPATFATIDTATCPLGQQGDDEDADDDGSDDDDDDEEEEAEEGDSAGAALAQLDANEASAWASLSRSGTSKWHCATSQSGSAFSATLENTAPQPPPPAIEPATEGAEGAEGAAAAKEEAGDVAAAEAKEEAKEEAVLVVVAEVESVVLAVWLGSADLSPSAPPAPSTASAVCRWAHHSH